MHSLFSHPIPSPQEQQDGHHQSAIAKCEKELVRDLCPDFAHPILRLSGFEVGIWIILGRMRNETDRNENGQGNQKNAQYLAEPTL